MNEIESLTVAEAPIVVDLDGTLLRTDLLHEQFILLICQKPWLLLFVPFWLLRGKAALKRELAQRITLDMTSLPVNEALLTWLRREKAQERVLALISASDDSLVQQFAVRFSGLFDIVQGITGGTNLAGMRKLEFIRGRLGSHFSYAGDEHRDLVIWEHCGSAILAGRGLALRKRLSSGVTVIGEFDTPTATLSTWVRALRVQQWAKNLLLFVPLVLSGNLFEMHQFSAVVVGFLALSILASGSYLFNDLMDLRADRLHRSKASRPLASGELPMRFVFLALPTIALTVVMLFTVLPASFVVTALTYLIVTLTYSLFLKRAPILDILTIATLFTLRIFAGAQAAETPASAWLLVFSMFFFFSLATVKRFSECKVVGAEGRSELTGRGYRSDDASTLQTMGIASGFCSLLVFFLFLVDPASPVSRYAHPEFLSAVCVTLAYWLGRAWLIASRGQMHDDVVIFALKDRVSLALGLLCVLLALLARAQ